MPHAAAGVPVTSEDIFVSNISLTDRCKKAAQMTSFSTQASACEVVSLVPVNHRPSSVPLCHFQFQPGFYGGAPQVDQAGEVYVLNQRRYRLPTLRFYSCLSLLVVKLIQAACKEVPSNRKQQVEATKGQKKLCLKRFFFLFLRNAWIDDNERRITERCT